jgi:endo-1,4-beta-xylanase
MRPTIFVLALGVLLLPMLAASGGEFSRRRGSVVVAGPAPDAVTSFNPGPGIPLRQAAENRGLLIGAAVSPEGLREATYARVLAQEFNLLVPENAMKWEPIHPKPSVWNFGPADRLVSFAADHQMKVKGHALIWHSQLPGYVASLSAEELRQAVREHIQGVVGRYRGRVQAWDVVNEALDGPNLRNTPFLERLGEGYIAEAFHAAHAADPDAVLFYNDYGCEGLGPKANRQFALLRALRAAGVPVHGVGLQMHLIAQAFPCPEEVAANVRRLGALGLRVQISEMDVRLRELSCSEPMQLQIQAAIYHRILAACARERGFDGITFWGFTDKHSWVHQHFGADQPLLFDTEYRPKPAYQGVRVALQGR